MQRFPWILFLCTSVILGIVFFFQIWNLRELYLQSALRTKVQTILQASAEQNGLLLSGLTIQELTSEFVHATYRDYLKGKDPETCYTIGLETVLIKLEIASPNMPCVE